MIRNRGMNAVWILLCILLIAALVLLVPFLAVLGRGLAKLPFVFMLGVHGVFIVLLLAVVLLVSGVILLRVSRRMGTGVKRILILMVGWLLVCTGTTGGAWIIVALLSAD